MTTVIWDWNGTLLNDLDFCISTINVLLQKRGLPLLTRNRYKEVFSFPVKDYYQAIGFDFTHEDFSVPAQEFIDLYNARVKNCSLHQNTSLILEWFKNQGVRQFVLSAMKESMLIETLKFNNLFEFFEGVAGLGDHYAVSKVERGLQLIRQFNIDKNNTVIIGDTTHDFEVASKLGLKCLLISDGHQSKSRLEKTGAKVLPDLNSLLGFDF